jgi:DNA polymerase I-like protein with 3'-5' exonuclease and polymerase domains
MIYFVTGEHFSEKDMDHWVASGVLPTDAVDSSYFDDATTFFVDTETTGLSPFKNKLLLFVIKAKDSPDTYVIDMRTKHREVTHVLYKLRHYCDFVFHNAQFDIMMLKYFLRTHSGSMNWNPFHSIHCTYVNQVILSRTDNDPKGKYTLENLVEVYCDKKLKKQIRNSFIGKPDLDPFSLEEIQYAAEDVQYLQPIFEIQVDTIKQEGLSYLAYVERKFIPIACDMTLNGIKLDVDAWRANIRNNEAQLKVYEQKLRDELVELNKIFPKVLNQRYKKYTPKNIIPSEAHLQMSMFDELDATAVLKQINFASSQHLMKIFEACEVKVSDTESGTLKQYKIEHWDSPVNKFIELLVGTEEKHSPCYKFYEKALSTYGENFIKEHAISRINGKTRDLYIHTSFGLVETKTGRLNSQDPNMQNIPKLDEFRNSFIAEDGRLLLTIDYTGCELAIAAHQSKCPVLKAAINDGEDLHSRLATVSYRIIKDDETFVVSKKQNAELRDKHKPILFGLLYGAGPSRIASVLNISKTVAKKVYNAIRAELPKLFEYLDKNAANALSTRCIVANNVTRRRLIFADEDKESHKIEKEAKNFPMQATNADLIKEAMCTVNAWIDSQTLYDKRDIKILLTVHDEIVFQVRDNEDAETIKNQIKNIMEAVGKKYTPGIDLKCTATLSKTWEK